MRPEVVLFHLSMIRSVEVEVGRELLVEGIWKLHSTSILICLGTILVDELVQFNLLNSIRIDSV